MDAVLRGVALGDVDIALRIVLVLALLLLGEYLLENLLADPLLRPALSVLEG